MENLEKVVTKISSEALRTLKEIAFADEFPNQ